MLCLIKEGCNVIIKYAFIYTMYLPLVSHKSDWYILGNSYIEQNNVNSSYSRSLKLWSIQGIQNLLAITSYEVKTKVYWKPMNGRDGVAF